MNDSPSRFRNRARRAAAVAALAMVVAAPAAAVEAEQIGQAVFSAGGAWPRGSFSELADPGPTLHFQIRSRSAVRAMMGWVDVSYTHFPERFSPGPIQVPGYSGPGLYGARGSAWSLMVGPLLSSTTRRGFFRPHVGAGLGFHLLRRDHVYSHADGAGSQIRRNGDAVLVGRFGWRGEVGVDFFPRKTWGVGLDAIYEHVENADGRSPARSQAFTMGLVLPFSAFE